jgi:hypothetical protein
MVVSGISASGCCPANPVSRKPLLVTGQSWWVKADSKWAGSSRSGSNKAEQMSRAGMPRPGKHVGLRQVNKSTCNFWLQVLHKNARMLKEKRKTCNNLPYCSRNEAPPFSTCTTTGSSKDNFLFFEEVLKTLFCSFLNLFSSEM